MKCPKNKADFAPKLYLTIPEAAEFLGIPASTLRRAVRRGLVPSYTTFSTRVRVRLSEVHAAIDMQREG